MAISKKELTALIQKLPDKDVPLFLDLVKRLTNHPLDEHIPYDDEPLTEDDIQSIVLANKEFIEGKTVKLKDIEHELRN
ncbi:MAG: hypothetical protein AB7V16_13570 [Vulcanibacillus sp.]